MAVESNGTILFKGESGPGHPVRVCVEPGRIRIEAGGQVIGDWSIHDIGLVVGDVGFSIRAEGEDFLLRAEDDVAIAEELGVAAASPRMARRVAARHNPDRPLPQDQERPGEPESKLAAIGLALSGALVIAGATLLDTISVEPGSFDPGAAALGGMRFWVAFLVCGIALVFFAFLMSIEATWARVLAMVTIASEVLLFGLLVNRGTPDPAALIAYGFVAGGVVVGVAVIFSGRPGISD
jgi:hypothetical protein